MSLKASFFFKGLITYFTTMSIMNMIKMQFESITIFKILFTKVSKAKAEDLLATSDFPTRKNEAWKYTNVNGLNKLLLDGESSDLTKPNSITKSAEKVYIINGQVSKDQSDVSGIKTSWGELPELHTEDSFDALNLH